MNKAVIGIFVACVIAFASVPTVASGSAPGVPGVPGVPTAPIAPMNWAAAPTFLPLYVTAMQDTTVLVVQLQEFLAGLEDTSAYEEQIAAINEQIALAAQGSNYVHKKDLVLAAKALLEQFFAA